MILIDNIHSACYVPIGFDPRLSLVLYLTDFDGEPVPVCIIPQQEHMDAVLPVVLVPVLQSD